MKNDFIFIFLAPSTTLLLLEILSFKPNLFFWILASLSLALVFFLKKIDGHSLFSLKFWLNLILPLLFVLSIAGYSLILPSRMAAQTIFIVAAIFVFYYFKNINRENNGPFLENISSYGGFLILFFSFSLFYGLKSFLGAPMLHPIAASMILTALVVTEVFWMNRISFRSAAPYIILICLIILQLSWSLYFLSLGHNFLGLILAISYYIAIGVVKPFLRGALTRKTIKLYLICGFGAILAVLLSTKWL